MIKDGGTHGNSYGSDLSRTIAPQATRVFDINAGRPKGVLPGAKIAKCNPKLQDAEIIALADAIRLERRHRGRHPAR